jgi:(p)ppGpp synthase/HD superfamily hydrolase
VLQLTDRQQKFWEFVVKAHGDQKRKYIHTPYTTHLWEVAEIAAPYVDSEGIVISLAHDLWEDTEVSQEETLHVLRDIGFWEGEAWKIFAGIRDLTDHYTTKHYPHLNRGVRKSLEAKRLGKIPPMIQTIKYADFISNTKSIAEHDPEFAVTYLKEKVKILDRMREGHIDLLISACSAIHEAQHKIIQNAL